MGLLLINKVMNTETGNGANIVWVDQFRTSHKRHGEWHSRTNHENFLDEMQVTSPVRGGGDELHGRGPGGSASLLRGGIRR